MGSLGIELLLGGVEEMGDRVKRIVGEGENVVHEWKKKRSGDFALDTNESLG